MAMTYQNFASLGVNLNRQKYGPLDISNVFTSAADLKYYLTKGTFTEGVSEYWYKNANEKIVPYPYEGQVLATVIDGVVSVYALSLDAEGNFVTQEIGAKVEVDGTTIVKDADGKLSIVAPVNPDEKKTYNFAYANGVYSWVEVDTATAVGQAQAIAGLTDRTVALEEAINGKGEGEEHVAGLTEKVAALEAVDNATQAELDAYKEVVTEAIAEALQAAKDYANENDANTEYNDTELRGRIEAIESDYLKEEDKYDDTELAGRVTTAEGKITTLEGAVGKAAEGEADATGLFKAIADEIARAQDAESDLSDRIEAIDFIDPTELADAIKDFATTKYVDEEIEAIETAISQLNHFTAKVVTDKAEMTNIGVLYLFKVDSATGSDVYEEYIVVDDAPVLIGDTTTDLSNYYDKDAIDGKVEALEGAIADEATARGELAEKVAALEAVDNATQEELDAYKLVVTQEIADAKQAAIDDADGKLADKLNTATFTEFQSTNTTAIATAKQEAIDAAADAEEAKGYAVATEVAETYATKDELTEAVDGIENDLLGYVTTSALDTALVDKADKTSVYTKTDVDGLIGTPGVPAQGEEGEEGYVAAIPGTGVYQHVYSKDEVTDLIADITGGESAADVLAALNAYKTTNDTRVKSVEEVNAKQTTDIAAAQAQADKGVEDAAKVAADLVAANSLIADNAREIGVAKSSIDTVNTTLTEKITALENADTKFTGDITALQGIVSGDNGHASRITALEGRATNLEAKDTELAALIQANTDKFANYYDKDTVDAKVKAAIDAIPEVDFTPYVTTETAEATYAKIGDAYTKAEADLAFMTEGEVDARINALIIAADPEGGKTITDIQNLVKYVDENAGEIAGLVTTVGEHTTAIAKNAEDIAAINEALSKVVQPKASTEISVAADGTLGINEMNVNKLVQTEGDTLVLNGGDAGSKAAE